jgi:hypothetical protein
VGGSSTYSSQSGVAFVTLPCDSSLRLCPVDLDADVSSRPPDLPIATIIEQLIIPALLDRLLVHGQGTIPAADASAKAERVESHPSA